MKKQAPDQLRRITVAGNDGRFVLRHHHFQHQVCNAFDQLAIVGMVDQQNVLVDVLCNDLTTSKRYVRERL